MSRITRDEMFMQMAEAAARRSTCYRGNTGAVLVRSGNDLVSIGYNGPPSGQEHCRGNSCDFTPEKGCHRSTHAEINALHRGTPRVAVGIEMTLYTTSSPCRGCAEQIIRDRVKRVVYRHEYRDPTPLSLLIGHGIKVEKLTPSGYLIEVATGAVLDTA